MLMSWGGVRSTGGVRRKHPPDQIPPPGDRPLSAYWEAKSLPRYVVFSGGMSRIKQALVNDMVAAFGHLDASTNYLLGALGGQLSTEGARKTAPRDFVPASWQLIRCTPSHGTCVDRY